MRAGIIMTALFVVALCCVGWGIVVSLLGDTSVGTFMVALGCFSMLCVTYLEVYMHRG